MKKALRKNWIPKIVSLLLAIAIWFLIRDYLEDSGEYYDRSGEYDRSGYDRNGYDRNGYDRNGYDREGKRPPKAIPVKPQSPADDADSR